MNDSGRGEGSSGTARQAQRHQHWIPTVRGRRRRQGRRSRRRRDDSGRREHSGVRERFGAQQGCGFGRRV